MEEGRWEFALFRNLKDNTDLLYERFSKIIRQAEIDKNKKLKKC